MQIKNIDTVKSFGSIRKDRKYVTQLARENKFSLTENNQKNIALAIENIASKGTKSSTEFLLSIAKNIRYSTNIKFDKMPKNRWMMLLMLAVASSSTAAGLSKNDEINDVFFAPKELTPEEQDIMNSYKRILEEVRYTTLDAKELEKAKNNLEYFIISSETSINDKKYVLERLEYFLSGNYELNSQLKPYEFQIFSEIVNDLALDKVNGDAPNTKAVNQKYLGTCASISIVRKLLAYEYKRNFIDVVLSELDSSDKLMVYDRNRLGQGVKIAVPKAYVDYEEAINQGYRIIDASVAHWMNYADITEGTDDVRFTYVAFDPENNSYSDLHIKLFSPDTGVHKEHDYYQALTMLSERLKRLKSSVLEEKFVRTKTGPQSDYARAIDSNMSFTILCKKVSGLMKDDFKSSSRIIAKSLLDLKKNDLEAIKEEKKIDEKYLYLPNEPELIIKNKIKSYLTDVYGTQFVSDLRDADIDSVYSALGWCGLKEPKQISKFKIAEQVVKVADGFKNAVLKGCLVPEKLQQNMVNLGLGDDDIRLLENIDNLIEKVEVKESEYIIEHISNIVLEHPSKEAVLEYLKECKEYVESLPQFYDDILRRMNLGSRYDVLKKEIISAKEVLESGDVEKIEKLSRLTAIYDIEELTERVNSAYEYLTHERLIAVMAEALGCESDGKVVSETIKNIALSLMSGDAEAIVQELVVNFEMPEEEVVPYLLGNAAMIEGLYDEECYKTAASLINQMSIKEDLFKHYSSMITLLNTGVSTEYLNHLLSNNGREPEIKGGVIQEVLEGIYDDINAMAEKVNLIAAALYIESPEGDVINSVYPPHIILSEYEKSGLLLKPSVLKSFHEKFDTYKKLVSEKDKYSKQEFKRKLQTLKQLGDSEKDAVNMMLANINALYRMVEREKQALLSEYKYDFEEIYRNVGLAEGSYWVDLKPSSGLYKRQQVAILEAVTDKPHYTQNNIEKAVEIIKEGPHSGISSTSVDDTHPAFHAQYIAAIDTVQVPSKEDSNKIQSKEVLFHDNSWGKSEHENFWRDVNGLLRTDYSNNYGYKYGYITDDKYRNGTYVNDLLYKSGKMVQSKNITDKEWKKLNPPEEFDFWLMNAVVLPGKSEKALSVAKEIKEELFSSDEMALEKLTEVASKMKPEEIKHKLKVLNEIAWHFYADYTEALDEIRGSGVNKGIQSKEQYDALSSNNKLKLMLEKAALHRMFADSKLVANDRAIINAKSLSELEDIRKELLAGYDDKFYYAFSKDISVVNSLITTDKNFNNLFNKVILPVLEDVQEVVIWDDAEEIIKEMKDMYFDGSLGSLAKNFASAVTYKLIQDNGEKITLEYAQELRSAISEYVVNELIIKPEDIEKGNVPKFIEEWIDKVYAPETDEEFLAVYRKLQGYTFDEFDNKAYSNFTQDDYGVKEVGGYDILKEIQAQRSYAEDALMNMYYSEEYHSAFDIGEVEDYIRYGKFSSKVTGYYRKHSFDESYIEIKHALNRLVHKKQFDKHKDDAMRKYGLMPAYPVLENDVSEMTQSSLDNIKSLQVRVSSVRNQIESFEIVRWFKDFVTQKGENPLTEEEILMVQKKLKRLLYVDEDEKSFKDLLPQLVPLGVLQEGETLSEFVPVIDKLHARAESMLVLCTEAEYQVRLLQAETDLRTSMQDYIKLRVRPEYRARLGAKMNEWLRAERFDLANKKEIYNELFNLALRYHISEEPVELLDDYLLNLALAIEEDKPIVSAQEEGLKALLANSKLIGIQEILMGANSNGITNAVAAEFDNIDLTLYARNEKGEFDYANKIVTPLSSKESITTMVKYLIVDSNYDVAKMFVEKLGLQEKAVPALINDNERMFAHDAVTKLEKLLEKIQEEEAVLIELRRLMEQVPQLNKDELIQQTNNFIDFLKQSKYDEQNNFYITVMIKTLENVLAIKDMGSLATLKTDDLYINLLDSVITTSSSSVANVVEDINDSFMALALIVDFLDVLNLEPYPELQKAKMEYLQEAEEILSKQQEIVGKINYMRFGKAED